MKLHIVGSKDTVETLVERLVSQLNAVFPEDIEVEDKEKEGKENKPFPIEFIRGARYNGEARSAHTFGSPSEFEGYCEEKSQAVLNGVTFVNIAGTIYRNIGSVVPTLAERTRAPEDGNIIITHAPYLVLRRGVKPVIYSLGKGNVDTVFTYYDAARALVLGCPNEVSPNHAKSVAFAIAAHLLIQDGGVKAETVYCRSPIGSNKCIMYGSLAEGVARTKADLDARALAFCDPCADRIIEAARPYLGK